MSGLYIKHPTQKIKCVVKYKCEHDLIKINNRTTIKTVKTNQINKYNGKE